MTMRAIIAAAALVLPGLATAQTPTGHSPSASPPAQPGAMPQQGGPGAAMTPEQAQAYKQHQEETLRAIVDRMKKGGENFQMKGTIADIDREGGAIMVQRAGQEPPAVLIIPPNVEIDAGGQKKGLADLQPGDQVRATFDLAQQYPIAIKIVKTGHVAPPPLAGPPGSTPPGSAAPGSTTPAPTTPPPEK